MPLNVYSRLKSLLRQAYSISLCSLRLCALAFYSLMPEVTHAGEDHGHAVFIGGGDDFVIAH